MRDDPDVPAEGLVSAPLQTRFVVATAGPGLHEITAEVTGWLRGTGRGTGLLTLFVRHTSCSLLIQENADADVRRDLDAFFRRLVPRADDPSMAFLRHRAEGPDDMPAHIRAAMMPVSLSIPVAEGRLALGTWQGIWVFEHRDRPHRREVMAHLA
jgi:secondary thiamine-phosphate synthase enzyme